MANPCCTRYVFFTNNEDKSELLRLHNRISSIMQVTPNVGKGFDPGCLGEVAKTHGIDLNKIPCRGYIEIIHDYEPDNNFISFETITDWCPMTELWEAVAAKYNDISFVYRAEEAGCDIFVNTDTSGIYIPERYLFEINGNMTIPEGWYPNQKKPEYVEIHEYFNDFDALNAYCAKITGITFDGFEPMKSYFDDILDGVENTVHGLHEFTTE